MRASNAFRDMSGHVRPLKAGAVANAGYDEEEVMAFRSRAVRSLVELHEREMRSFRQAWSRFAASDLPMPEAHGDESYENPERLAGHVLMAARGKLTRMRPVGGPTCSNVDC